jgi:hypothetical protein
VPTGARAAVFFVVMAVVALVALPARAQFVVSPVNLVYLSRRAGVIVQGRVTNARYEPLPGYDHIPTVRVTLEVERMIRGPQVRRYTFRQWLMPLRSRREKYQTYQPGQDLLLFLLSPSASGLSSPIGHEQGKFHIERDARGREFIANEFSNGGIFNGVESGAAAEGLRLSASERRLAAARGGPVDLESFVSLVKSLAALPRIE